MGASPEMTADDVLGFLRLTKSLGVDIWIDGGWAVDACLGEQTRRHADLDIVIAQSDLETVVIELRVRGWTDVPRDDTRPWNFVLGDDRGHEVDFHVVVLDEQGRGVYGPSENDDYWPAAALNWSGGVIGGQPVRCTSPDWLISSHSGYELKDKDLADIAALNARFGTARGGLASPDARGGV